MSSNNYFQDEEQNFIHSNGIAEIRQELPSQTVGRRRGEYLERMLSDESFFEQTMARSVRRRKKTPDHGSRKDNPALAADDFKRIESGEIRDLPFSMKFKRNLRKKFEQQQRKIGNSQKEKYKKKAQSKDARQQIKSSISIWSGHLKKIEGNFGTGVASYFLFLRGLFFLSVPSFILSFCFISVPQIIEPPPRVDPNVTFNGEELLTGSNWLSDTIMYYGHYVNGTISPNSVLNYDMTQAYLFSLFFYFLVCLVWLFRETAITFRISYVDATLDWMNFSNKVFCSWNYGIMSKQSASLLHNSIYLDLKEVLAEKKPENSKDEQQTLFSTYTKRVLIWIVWMVVTGGSVAFVYYLNLEILPKIQTNSGMFNQLLLAIFVSTVNLIMPYLIIFLTNLENYKNPRTEMFIAVFRTFFLKIGMLAAICAYWTQTITDEAERDSCWETKLGEEVYRLVIFDFIFSIVFSTFCMEFLRRIISNKFNVGSKAIFQITINVLDLIYGQTLCWIGIYFSPILSLIVIIKYILLFYIKKVSVLANCRPSKRRWRASQSRTFFNILLSLCFLTSFGFIAYVIYSVKPSDSCGPFRGLNNSYTVVANTFGNVNESEWFAIIISIIFNVWFLFGVVIALLIYMIFLRSRTQASKDLTERLKEQIALQGQDKILLLNWIRSLSDSPSHGRSPNPIEKQHRAPEFLQRHRDSVNSRIPSSRSSSMIQPNHSRGFVSPTDVQMTHQDPQHAHLNADNTTSPDAFRRRPQHTDPILTRAFNNQVRPMSHYVPQEDVNPFEVDVRPYSQSVSHHSRNEISPLKAALASKEASRHNRSGYPVAEEWNEMEEFDRND